MKPKKNPLLTVKSEFGTKLISNGRKVDVTKTAGKRYKVIVKLVEVSSEEAKIKRAIIEDILKDTQG